MRKVIEFLTVAATFAVSANPAMAVYNPPPACPDTPTLEQCQSPTFMYGTCGQPFLEDARTHPDAICNVLLRDAALAAAAPMPEAEVLVPTVVDAAGGVTHAGGTDDARQTPRIDEALAVVGGQSLTESAGAAAAAGEGQVAIRMGWQPIAMMGGGDGDFPLPPLPPPDEDPVPPPPEPEPEPEPTPAPPATGHDAPVGSCADYARDKYDSYTLFNDAAAALGEDHRAVFDLAYGPVIDTRSIANRMLFGVWPRGTDGRLFSITFPAGMQPKNTWFTVEQAPAQDYSIDGTIDPGDGSLRRLKGVVLADPGIAATLTQGAADHIEDFDWHFQMSQALSAELDERLVQLERSQADFAELLARRDIVVEESIAGLRAAMRSAVGEAMEDCFEIGGPRFDPEDDMGEHPIEQCLADIDGMALTAGARAQVNARLAAIDNQIGAALAEADDEGCLALNQVTACDWSPRRFNQRMLDTVGAERQRAYEKCIDYTNDDFVALADYTFTHPIDGSLMHSRRDYTTSPAAVDRFMTRRDNWRDALSDALEEVLDAEGGANGSPRLAGEASDAVQMGNSMFGMSYGYDMSWQVFDLEHGLCNLSATFDGDFEASITVLGQEEQLVAADAHAGFDRIDVDLEIFDQSLVDLHQDLIDQETYTLVDGEHDREEELLDKTHRFTILGIPMSLSVGASGKVGLTYGLEARIDRGGNDCDEVSATLAGRVTPFVEFDGFAEVAVDFLIAKAGVKGDLALVHVRLPFTLEVGVGAENGNVANLALMLRSTLDAAVRVMDGTLKLYAEVGIGPLSESAEKTFFSWTGIEFDYDVIDLDLDVPLSSLAIWFNNPS